MRDYKYDLIFTEQKEKKFSALVNYYIEYIKKCDYKVKVTRLSSGFIEKKIRLTFSEKFNCKVKAIEDCQKKCKLEYFNIKDFPNSNHLDDFKSDIIQAFFKEYDTPNGISLVIENDLDKLCEKYSSIRKRNSETNQETRFNYNYFETFSHFDAIELFAIYIAYEEYAKYLSLQLNAVYDKENSTSNNIIVSKGIGTTLPFNIIQDGDLTKDEKNKLKKEQITLVYNNKVKAIITLHTFLYKYDYISEELPKFYSHFTNEARWNKIVWNGEASILLYIVHKLKTRDTRPHKIVFSHFVKTSTEEFDLGVLYSSYSRIINREKGRNANYEGKYAKIYSRINDLFEEIEEND